LRNLVEYIKKAKKTSDSRLDISRCSSSKNFHNPMRESSGSSLMREVMCSLHKLNGIQKGISNERKDEINK